MEAKDFIVQQPKQVEQSLQEIKSSELFKQNLKLVGLRVPNTLCAQIQKKLKGCMIERAKLKPVIEDKTDQQKRIILLREDITKEQLASSISPEANKIITDNKIELIDYPILLSFENWTTDQAIRRVLPSNIESFSSFEIIGHIAHVNLREDHIPYKKLIGEIILEKNPKLKTVVNKVGQIENQFRTFQMEILAGEPSFDTELKESNCIFKFNFSEVYWNSRLQREHERIVAMLNKKDIVCDMFAGIGPFAVPAAKNVGCFVYANDLNPKSYLYLKKNCEYNKVVEKVKCFNLDARDFVRSIVSEEKVPITQVLMNLPASAEEFLDVFPELYKDNSLIRPTIHCYGFSKSEDPKADIVQRIEKILGAKITPHLIHEVRDVAPKKLMMCVSFPLPYFNSDGNEQANSTGKQEELLHLPKKQKLDSEK